MVIETHDPEETFEVGRTIGMNAKPGQIYTLTGDLGVGKTVFTQGVAAGLGITEPVNSPTFTIIQEYEDGRLVLAFRVAPINEVVEVKGEVYTRSASSNLIKPVGNVADFVKLRHRQKLDSVPKMPEFPAYFSAERNEYIF